jgi:[ribosomal protein S5]-alanine N-acetyltransferase
MREACTDDKHFFFELLNTPKWLKYIGDKNIKTPEDAEKYVTERLIKSYKRHGFGLYVMQLASNGIAIGISGFVKRDYLEYADIGFALLPAYEQQGFSYEAALSVLQYGRDQLGFSTIQAITSKENIASQSLLKKLGFKFTSHIIEPVSRDEICLFSNS